MKYQILFFSLLSIAVKSTSQPDTSLTKYSYLLVGIKTVKDSVKAVFPIGTCFFARRGNDLFLITAKHNINGFSTFNLKPTKSQFDTVGFRYFDPRTKKISFTSLNIKEVKSYFLNDYFFNSPDAIVLKMNDPIVNPLLHSIESFMVDDIKEKPDSVVAFGFAFKESYSISETTPTYYSGYLQPKKDPFYPVNDSLYYVTSPISIQGMSGSPVFFKYIKNKKSYFSFAGIMFGTDASYNSAYIVSPSIIRQQIVNFLSPRN